MEWIDREAGSTAVAGAITLETWMRSRDGDYRWNFEVNVVTPCVMKWGTSPDLPTAKAAALTAAREWVAELAKGLGLGPEERSCFTCRYSNGTQCHKFADPCDPIEVDLLRKISSYIHDSGSSIGGHPTDRTVACPGWSAKTILTVTTRDHR